MSDKTKLMDINEKKFYITIFVFISCVLFLFFAMGLMKNPYGQQRLIFFNGMNDFFADYLNLLRITANRDPYFTPFFANTDLYINYLPLPLLIIYPLTKLDNYSAMTLQDAWNSKMALMSAFIFTGFSVFLLFKSLSLMRKKFHFPYYFTVLTSFALSYIFLITVERGNLIILSAASSGFFICYYDSVKKYERIMAAICLAFATVLKFYPVLFGFLYFEKKQYREIFLSATITLLLGFLPFIFFKRGFANIPQLINTLRLSNNYNNFTGILNFSLVHLVFFILALFKLPGKVIMTFVNITTLITFILSFISIIFSLKIKNKWLKLSLLTMTFLFLPSAISTGNGFCYGLYVFPIIIIYFSTLEERSKLFNIFTFIIFVVFINPYQITFGYQFILNYPTTLNYIFINFTLIIFWFVLLIYTGRQIFINYRNRR